MVKTGLKDSALWLHVKDESLFLITADKGFGDVRFYPPGSHPGILLLRPHRDRPSEFRVLSQSVLMAYRLEALTGCVTVATPSAIRIRRPN